MKIEHLNGPVTDTDTLPDIEALILEKAKELCDLCGRAERQIFLNVDEKGRLNGSGTLFYSIFSRGKNPVSPVENKECMNNFLSMINSPVKLLTSNQYSIK